MGVFHPATITPTKAEIIAEWAPSRSWGPSEDAPRRVVGVYRFDDPENCVGMETHLVATDDELLQIPPTYRDEGLTATETTWVSLWCFIG